MTVSTRQTKDEVARSRVEEANVATVMDMLERVFHRNDPTVLNAHPGLIETVAVMTRRAAAFPDLSFRVERVIAEGDTVAYLVRLRGTHLGEFAGVPPSGKTIEYSAIGIDRLENGTIVEYHANPDFQAIFGQLGVLPRNPA